MARLFYEGKGGRTLANILLEMKNITKTFPGVKALDNVNLQVEEGEIHALVGENGAGKSTLMNWMLEACAGKEGPASKEEKKVMAKDMLFATLDTTVTTRMAAMREISYTTEKFVNLTRSKTAKKKASLSSTRS